jgi:thiamine transporter ThiT
MNLKLVFLLSLFGLAMAVATVFFIPDNLEPFFWVAIFLICAIVIANRCRKAFFLHGLLVGLLNSVWITGVHLLLFRKYISNHQDELAMMSKMQYGSHPRFLMLFIGPIVGLVSGLILGLLAFLASRLIKGPAKG